MNGSAPATPTRYGAIATRLVIVLMAAALLTGCGKKGNPVPPADEPVTYPQGYPKT
jgi:predicted small lipoprotein YifL